jgi:hypothetical protein
MNPSFEIYSNCPNGYDLIGYSNFWSGLDSLQIYRNYSDGEPEYCNACDVTNAEGVPRGQLYYHFARTGVAMAQVQMFYDEIYTPLTYKRDYLQGRLKSTLLASHSYCVIFYVSLEQYSQFANGKIGAYLDNGIIDTTKMPGMPQTEYAPQILHDSIIYDTLNWIKIEGSFIASGNEHFITIGNFFNKANTNYVAYAPWGQNSDLSWYLVDDISVIESNTLANAGNDTAIHKGDSILIGEIAVPYTWYKRTAAGLSLIDSVSGGIWVKPDTTTTYVVKLTLCGVVTWDSIKVTVVPVGINNIKANESNLLYPNPITNELNITNAPSGTNIKVYDVVGRLVYNAVMHDKQETINTSAWERGTYFVELVLPDGSREVRKVVK